MAGFHVSCYAIITFNDFTYLFPHKSSMDHECVFGFSLVCEQASSSQVQRPCRQQKEQDKEHVSTVADTNSPLHISS